MRRLAEIAEIAEVAGLKPGIRIKTLALFMGVAAISLIISLKKPAGPPSLRFIGYTNTSFGRQVALFTVSNGTPQTLTLLNSQGLFASTHSQQRVFFWSGSFATGPLNLKPGQTATVPFQRPPPALGPWRAKLEFAPASTPFVHRIKRWLHLAGVPIDTPAPTVSAMSDVMYLDLIEAVHSLR